jgi:putative nucleotidyltransferase with HDIG domain
MSLFTTVDQLQVGLFVQLDLHWMDHPFGFNSFKIKSEEQIRLLRQLGLERIRYDPNRSTAKPLPANATPPPQPAAGLTRDDPLIQAKRARAEYLKRYRRAVTQAEQALHKAALEVCGIYAKLPSRPVEARADAEALIDHVARTFLGDPDATIHAMGGKEPVEALHHHGLNVTVLSMIMAKGLGMSEEDGKVLGLGALFHDIGLSEIPPRVLRKTDPLTAAEHKLRQMHCEYGIELGKRLDFPQTVLDIIGQHHELADGSGYPKQLKGAQIAPMARLVQVANRYDSLCNPTMPAKAMSPHEALSVMYAQQSAGYRRASFQRRDGVGDLGQSRAAAQADPDHL